MVRKSHAILFVLGVLIVVGLIMFIHTRSTGAIPVYDWKIGENEIAIIVPKGDEVETAKMVNGAGLVPFALQDSFYFADDDPMQDRPILAWILSSNSKDNQALFEEVEKNSLTFKITTPDGEEVIVTDPLNTKATQIWLKLPWEWLLITSTNGKGWWGEQRGEYAFLINFRFEKSWKEYACARPPLPVKLEGEFDEKVTPVSTPYFVKKQDVVDCKEANVRILIDGPDGVRRIDQTLDLKFPANPTAIMSITIAKDASGKYAATVTPGKPGIDPGIDPGGNGGKDPGTGKAVNPKGKTPVKWGDIKKQ
ncbi:MAG: hypothetical protein A2445_00055 [Candidatus Jacksonbacteria bacterium RIFOXYC2_FULL_44_29]|nr:MAG: hypothetical protein UW45_C0061G0001 [Parcubacteria group bacterium GW2011_GWC2_44_22]OGY77616.1 MAG: hypothetical protein A2295_01555 [Candidatus Jacksonbacteria bacterium RIFOXYB2_FULL_44_15]OGY80238.1 MAG: hypothetical protein A2445_00055 [Candidatus Jacksonbacteria bacterium RIFOXYC2_FULL_44_29]OGY82148.1 MAG: hypothetical protein A2550_02970 [Candidatus Jacksonbacteria bacterium RIFOXYD2_FULL_43_21]HBH46771.1 hypothetical protein [Candidatus Jacksonbacteria bacterium]